MTVKRLNVLEKLPRMSFHLDLEILTIRKIGLMKNKVKHM